MVSQMKGSSVAPVNSTDIIMINVLDVQGGNCHKLESRFHNEHREYEKPGYYWTHVPPIVSPTTPK